MRKESRRSFFQKSAVTFAGLITTPALFKGQNTKANKVEPLAFKEEEWRNMQAGMSYRKLGRTGMMVSEIVMGAFPYTEPKYLPVMEAGIEKGINYIDTAYSYGQGKSEEFIGNYLKKSRKREDLFIATKLSSYYDYIDGIIKDILNGLPQTKKNALHNKVQSLLEERRVLVPGYHVYYFEQQKDQFENSYLRHIVLQEYGYKKEWKQEIKKHAYTLLEGALKRLNTDYIDVLHCPHGISMPEMMDDEILRELFEEFKMKGLIRNAACSFHNDVAGNLEKAMEVGYYDAAMFAYNIANSAALESLIYEAKQYGLGLIAMKVARAVSQDNSPQWRLDKLNLAIPGGELSKQAKAYLWGLQNPHLSCCNTEMHTLKMVDENCTIVGKKVDMQRV